MVKLIMFKYNGIIKHSTLLNTVDEDYKKDIKYD